MKLIGSDIYDRELVYPSMLVDIFYRVPMAISSDYIDTLLAICLREEVQYVIPLADPEVDVLSAHRNAFLERGIIVCIASEPVIKICRNKKLFFDYLSGMEDLHLLPTYTFESLFELPEGPIIAKPKIGRSSEGQIIIEERNQITALIKDTDKYIFQPFLRGTVVTVDIVRDSFGNFFFIPREELLRTKNGAGVTVRLLSNNMIKNAMHSIVSRLDVLGCMNIEFLYDGVYYYLMDINPRFSAGVAFSQLTGYDFVRSHLKAFLGDKIAPGISYDSQVIYKRYIEFV